MQFIYVISYSVTHILALILLSSPILLLTSRTMKATGGESFDHLTSLPLQAFPNVYSKAFHSMFSQKQFVGTGCFLVFVKLPQRFLFIYISKMLFFFPNPTLNGKF